MVTAASFAIVFNIQNSWLQQKDKRKMISFKAHGKEDCWRDYSFYGTNQTSHPTGAEIKLYRAFVVSFFLRLMNRFISEIKVKIIDDVQSSIGSPVKLKVAGDAELWECGRDIQYLSSFSLTELTLLKAH